MKTYFTILQKVINTKTIIYPEFKKTFDLENGIWSNYYNNEDKNNKHIYYIYTFMNYIQQTPDDEKDLYKLIKLKYQKIIDFKKNTFLPKLNEELFDIFAKAQRVYNGFNILAKIFRSKRKIDKQYDLLINELDVNNRNTIKVYHNNWMYLFSAKDLINLINTSLSNCDSHFADPKKIKNPFNNVYFTKANLYNIYFKVKSLDYKMPVLFHQYFMCNFDIQRFEIENESLIRENNIYNIVFKTNPEILFTSVKKMLERSKGDGYKIHSDVKNVNLDEFLKISRPYYYLYLISHYYVEGTEKKRRCTNLFKRKIHELFYYNPHFGRLSMKRKALGGNFKKAVNLDAPKFTMKEVYEYNNIIENESDNDTEDENQMSLDSEDTRLPMRRIFPEEDTSTAELRNLVTQLMLGE